mgnify:CR=1 FL=1
MEYIVRILLTLVIWIFLVFFISQIPDFGIELGDTATTIFGLLLVVIPLVLGWVLSGKIVDSDVY